MTLRSLTVLYSVVCLAVLALQLAESQDFLPAPTLAFGSEVNQSAIKLYSSVPIVCTIPDNAKKPAEVHLSKANATSDSSPLLSYTLQRQSLVTFTLIARPDHESAFVCWYTNTRSNTQSQFSKPISIVISALSSPIGVFFPHVFPVGAKYTVQCWTPQIGYTNTTLSVYDRLLPIRPGKESFEYISSRALTPGEWGAEITRTNAGETYEYQCEMEVFINGRTLRSRSDPVTAKPEELSVHLVSTGSGLERTCYGLALLKVSDDWKPLCFVSKNDRSFSVASVVCRELGCGPAIDYQTLSDKSHDAVGTPNCTGTEKKIAECPLSSANVCDQGTLNIICSEALPPPTLSVSGRGAAARVYVRTEESVTLVCIFQSSINENAYVTFTHNGEDHYTVSSQPGYKVTKVLSDPVTEGEYACYVHPRASHVYRTEKSNVIGIYIYNPPPAGAVAGGVITTLLGLIILVLICIFGASKRDAQDPEPGSALSGSTTSPPHGVPESTGQIPS